MFIPRLALVFLAGLLSAPAQTVLEQDETFRLIERAAELERNGQAAEAEQILRSVITKVSDFKAAVALNELGLLYCVRGKYNEAERAYKRSLKVLSTSDEPNRAEMMARVKLNLAAVYVEWGRLQDAEKLNLETDIQNLTDPFDISDVKCMSAALAMARGDLAAAEQLYTSVLPYLRSDASTRGKIALATTLNNLGTISLRRKDVPGAVARLEGSLEAWKTAVGPNYPNLLKGIANLASVYMEGHRYAEAATRFEEAATLAQQSLGTYDDLTIALKLCQAEALRKAGRSKEAKQLKREAELARGAMGADPSRHTVDLSTLLSMRDRR